MDLIRDSAFLTTLLHCVLAHSLPQIDYLKQNPGSYDSVSPVPGSGILQIPYDKIPEVGTQTLVVNPSWQNRPSLDNADLVRKDEAKNSQPHSYKAERPGTTLKGIGLKYPLTMPRVKLSFNGQSGILPVKNIQNTPAPIPELPSKEPKPTGSEPSITPGNNKRLVGRVHLYKNIQTPTKPENLDHASKLVLNPTSLYPPTIPSSIYGQKLLSNAFQYTQSLKPELPALVLNPTNAGYPPTNPGIVYGNYEAVKSVLYTPTHKLDHSGKEGLKSTNFKYPTNPDTSSYKTYVPEIAVPKLMDLGYPPNKINQSPVEAIQHTPPYKADPPVGVLKATNLDYFPTKPVGRDENTTAIKLPPVPTTMPLLRRIQLALMNTVAGLPGGNQQALDSIRAR